MTNTTPEAKEQHHYAHGGVDMPQEHVGPTQRRFRPRLWPSLIALVMLGCLIALGNWQTRRYHEATTMIAAYAAQHDEQGPVARLDSVAGAADDDTRLHALHFRRAALPGHLEPEATQLLTARYVLGRRGYGVMMPMRVDNGPKPKILVHLGWVPQDKVAAFLAEVRATPERVIKGRLQVPNLERVLAPTGSFVGHPTWLRAMPFAIAETMPDLEPRLMLQAGDQANGSVIDPDRVPIDGYVHPVRMHPNKHVEYAATWYGLALTLVAVWLALSIKKEPLAVVEAA